MLNGVVSKAEYRLRVALALNSFVSICPTGRPINGLASHSEAPNAKAPTPNTPSALQTGISSNPYSSVVVPTFALNSIAQNDLQHLRELVGIHSLFVKDGNHRKRNVELS